MLSDVSSSEAERSPRHSRAQGEPEGSFSKSPARIPPRGGAEDSVELNAGGHPGGKPREAIELGDDSVQ